MQLQLEVISHYGQGGHAPWQPVWTQERCSLEPALLALMSPMAADEELDFIDHASACVLMRLGAPAQYSYWLSNQGSNLRCYLNHKLLCRAEQIRLQADDRIELGLSVWRVRLVPSVAAFEAQRSPSATQRVRAAQATALGAAAQTTEAPQTTQATHLGANFELTDLLRMHDLREPQVGRLREEELQRPSPLSQDLRDLGNAQTLFAQQDDSLCAKPSTSDAPSTPNTPNTTPDPTVAAPSNASQEPPSAAPADPSPATDPLHTLHQDYLRHLKTPHLGNPNTVWREVSKTAVTQIQEDPLERLKQEAQAIALLGVGVQDLVERQPSMSELIRTLNSIEPGNILAPDVQPNVMHLFAPKDLLPTVCADVWMPSSDLPPLTRHEHHGVALDSAGVLQTAARPSPLQKS